MQDWAVSALICLAATPHVHIGYSWDHPACWEQEELGASTDLKGTALKPCDDAYFHKGFAVFRKIRKMSEIPSNFGAMDMKTMTASAASKEFGFYIDTVQHEPVVITKQNRPVAITISIQEAERLFKDRVDSGIQRGLDDVAAGRYAEMTSEYLETMREKFKAKIK